MEDRPHKYFRPVFPITCNYMYISLLEHQLVEVSTSQKFYDLFKIWVATVTITQLKLCYKNYVTFGCGLCPKKGVKYWFTSLATDTPVVPPSPPDRCPCAPPPHSCPPHTAAVPRTPSSGGWTGLLYMCLPWSTCPPPKKPEITFFLRKRKERLFWVFCGVRPKIARWLIRFVGIYFMC